MLILIYMDMIEKPWLTAVCDRPNPFLYACNFKTNLTFFDVVVYEISYWDLNEMYIYNGKYLS